MDSVVRSRKGRTATDFCCQAAGVALGSTDVTCATHSTAPMASNAASRQRLAEPAGAEARAAGVDSAFAAAAAGVAAVAEAAVAEAAAVGAAGAGAAAVGAATVG